MYFVLDIWKLQIVGSLMIFLQRIWNFIFKFLYMFHGFNWSLGLDFILRSEVYFAMLQVIKISVKDSIQNVDMETCWLTAFKWMPQNLSNQKSTMVQVMAWCHQATSMWVNVDADLCGIIRLQLVHQIFILENGSYQLYTMSNITWQEKNFVLK